MFFCFCPFKPVENKNSLPRREQSCSPQRNSPSAPVSRIRIAKKSMQIQHVLLKKSIQTKPQTIAPPSKQGKIGSILPTNKPPVYIRLAAPTNRGRRATTTPIPSPNFSAPHLPRRGTRAPVPDLLVLFSRDSSPRRVLESNPIYRPIPSALLRICLLRGRVA